MAESKAPAGGSFLVDAAAAEVFTPEQLSADARLMARTMAEFVRKEVQPAESRLESHEPGLLAALMRKAGDIGLLAGTTPTEYGGLGLSKSELAILGESAARSSSFAISVGVHTGIAMLPLLMFGTAAQKQKYLPKMASGETIAAFCLTESGAGSDALAASSRATLCADASSYALNGAKMWITNAEIADLFVVFAKVDGDKLTAFLVERKTPGLTLGREEHKLGIRGSSTRRVIFEDCIVPASNVLGEVGKGYRPALYSLNLGRFNIGVGALGNGKECLRLAAEYALQRTQFGRSIGEFGAIRHKLGEMAIRLFALESMVYRVAGAMDGMFAAIDYSAADASDRLRDATEEYAIECAIIKFYGTEVLAYVVDESLQIHGGNGFSEEYPIARHYRDARVSRIYEGTNEINRLTVVDQIIKRAERGRLGIKSALEGVSGGVGDTVSDSPGEIGLLRGAVLGALGMCWDAISGDVDRCQEIALKIADLCGGLLAIESAHLRARQVGDSGSLGLVGATAARALRRELACAIRDAGEQIAAIVGTDWADDELRRFYGIDMIGARRAVSDAVLARGGYPWDG